MESKRKKAVKWLVVGLVLCLISMIGASLVQTGAGKINVKDLRWETTQGHQMSGLLFVPENVTAENPAPGIVVSHGMYNNREMQDLNFVELSRRGYVVLSMDMYSHGHSESWTTSSAEILTGMYEAVKMMDTLSIVDSEKIGITGHSLGGMSSNMAVVLDNEADEQLISAVLLNCANATFVDSETGEYANIYGSRDVGMVAAQYDEWFFRQDDGEGGTTAPRDFIKYSNAQSFLHFGENPQNLDTREADTIYTEKIENEEAFRVVYTPAIIHPWSHFSQKSTKATIEFFEQSLGAPQPIDAQNQIWQWKVVFNALGVIGFGIFLVSFTVCMVFTPFFSSLRAKEMAGPVAVNKQGKAWVWSTLLLSAAFGTVIYLPIMIAAKAHASVRGLWRQSSPWGIGLWAAACGVVAILCMVVSYRAYGKKNKFSLADRSVLISGKKLGKTILLALIVVAVSYGLVFFADYFFKVDFRIWVIALKVFNAEKVLVALFPYLPLFLIYYVANSVAVNAFNYIQIGKKEWTNTLVLAIFNMLPAAILLLMQYSYFFISGQLLFESNMFIVWLFPFLVILPAAAVISRKIYRVTNNPYLGGIICGILVTLISCSNTLTFA